jgi:protein dithiol oxidoreductase (disulfide-forming)
MRNMWLMTALLCAVAGGARAEAAWIEGQHYFLLDPAQPTDVAPGKIEVVEVFSYGCPACNLFYPVIDRLRKTLPARVQLKYLPASWHVEEDWKMFQRAFFAAQSLGIAERTHDAVFDAVWKTGELATLDMASHRLKAQLPTLVDAANFYARVAKVKAEDFLQAAHSFSVDASMRQADAQIRAYQADETPTIIVNGKYRLTPRSAGSNDAFIELVQWLIGKESKRSP